MMIIARKKGIIGIILTVVGIFLSLVYSYTSYSSQQSYVRLMCAVAWTSPCTAVNNALMLGMGMLGVGLLIAISGMVVVFD
jgi:hypothetical protein